MPIGRLTAKIREMLQATPLRRWPLRIAAASAGLTFTLAVLYYAAIAWLGPPPFAAVAETSRLVNARDGRLLRPFTTSAGLWRLPARVEDVDPRYFALLFAYEDRRFYQHHGVDGRAFGRAIWQFVRNGRAISGASTLTMQAARLLDNRPTRSYTAKVGQVFRAWQLEGMMSKREILELYLRLAPFGGNIEGVRAASLAYFGKEPKRLSVAEAALLVALPQSPEQRRPDRASPGTRIARDRVIERAAAAGVISRAEADFAKLQPVQTARHQFPSLTAHLAGRQAAAVKGGGEVRLTIDAQLQEGVETLAARHTAKAGPKLSAAVMVVDHQTGEVLAHAGSAGYFDSDRNGPIDMTLAVRSPGSALKPFIYGLAFEAGLAHPETLIEDRPCRIGGYAPQNFDNTFHGTVTVRQALQSSLNIPAVKMLAAISPARLSARFRQAAPNVEVPRNLAVALGGVGLRLEDLIGLYAALARGGDPVGLHYVYDEAAPQEQPPQPDRPPLLKPLAAWYVADILRGATPPALAKWGSGIAYKTGTSYGYRDGWAAGFDGRHVVAVWMGRADGTPTPGLTGLTSAAPLLFDVFSLIGPDRAPFRPAPGGALIASTTALPPPLQHFHETGTAAQTAAATPDPPVHIAFPPDKAELELSKEADGATAPVALKAEGGVLPLTWLIDGAPIEAAPHRREAYWTPLGEGFAQVSVIDAEGRVDRVTVRLR